MEHKTEVQFDFNGNIRNTLRFISDVDNAKKFSVTILNNTLDDSTEVRMRTKQGDVVREVVGVRQSDKSYLFILPNLVKGNVTIEFLAITGENRLSSKIIEAYVKQSLFGLDVSEVVGISIFDILEKIKILENQIETGGSGTSGNNGKSAYELAVQEGYQGTLVEWLKSLKGQSAYDIAVSQGFEGNENDFINDIRGTKVYLNNY